MQLRYLRIHNPTPNQTIVQLEYATQHTKKIFLNQKKCSSHLITYYLSQEQQHIERFYSFSLTYHSLTNKKKQYTLTCEKKINPNFGSSMSIYILGTHQSTHPI